MLNFRRAPLLLPALCGVLLACSDDDSSSDSDSGTDPGAMLARDSGPMTVLDSGAGPVDIDSGAVPKDAAAAAVDASQPIKSAFSLDFAAISGGKTVGCGDTLTGLGMDGTNTASIDDLRLYVSKLEFFDATGNSVDLTLDSNAFQLLDAAGNVSLIDLTSNTVGACNPDNFPESEGTARVHPAITGTTFLDKVASIKFNVGLPQALMKKVIANNTQEGAPSPLAELSWSWAGGYRFFVWNLALNKAGDAAKSGTGYVHVGSTGCSADGVNALADKNECANLNTPAVALTKFSLASNKVTIDLDAIVKKLDFMAETYNEKFEVNGTAPGVACHSGMQGDCPDVFAAFGLSLETGVAEASTNIVFGVGTK